MSTRLKKLRKRFASVAYMSMDGHSAVIIEYRAMEDVPVPLTSLFHLLRRGLS